MKEDNNYYIDYKDLFDFHNLMSKTNTNLILKQGWLGNGIYDFEENLILSYTEWKKWCVYLETTLIL